MFSFLPPFPVSPKLPRALDVSRLAALVAAAQQNHKRCSVSPAVDSVTGPHVDAKLQHSFAHLFGITKRPSLNLTYPPGNSGLRPGVPQAFKPFVKWALTLLLLVNDDIEHG
jgi:hypothetical protein